MSVIAVLGCTPAGSDDFGDPDGPAGGKADDIDPQERAALVLGELDRFNADLTDEDRATKFGKMAVSPFTFYRGTAHLFWLDIEADERRERYGNTDTVTWVQGDMHAANFGAFADDDGRIVYDLNDFDEGVIDDYQFDVWRMATSIVLVGRDNGLSDDETRSAVDAFALGYIEALESFRGNGSEDDFRMDESNANGRLDEFLADVAAGESREEMLAEWTTIVDGDRVFDESIEDLGPAGNEVVTAIEGAFDDYQGTLSGGLAPDPDYFAIKSIAKRLNAGTGSLGTPRYYALIEGPSTDPDDDVILDIKRQGTPTAANFSIFAEDSTRAFAHSAERVARARRALTNDVDDHVGWLELSDGAYSVAERNPFKKSFKLEKLDTETRLVKLAAQWGAILAAAHARADRDHDESLVSGSFEAAVLDTIDSDDEGFAELVGDVAFAYGDQVRADYDVFLGSLE